VVCGLWAVGSGGIVAFRGTTYSYIHEKATGPAALSLKGVKVGRTGIQNLIVRVGWVCRRF
jgi:hypothetical protein